MACDGANQRSQHRQWTQRRFAITATTLSHPNLYKIFSIRCNIQSYRSIFLGYPARGTAATPGCTLSEVPPPAQQAPAAMIGLMMAGSGQGFQKGQLCQDISSLSFAGGRL